MRPLRSTQLRLALSFSIILSCSMAALAANEESMFLDLNLNHTPRGEFVFYRRPDGDFLISVSDLSALGLHPVIGSTPVNIEGESNGYMSLRDLGAHSLEMDVAHMTLDAELPAQLFEASAIDLAASTTSDALSSVQNSGFLNYRLAQTAYGSETVHRTLATELGLRFGAALFLNQNLLREDGSSSRYITQLVIDRPENQQRWTLGDFTASSSELGSALPMGGLNLSKLYSLTPELVRQPVAGFSGVTESPSTVEVRVNGVPVAQSQVGAGPFALQNLRQYGGASDVQVVVRDALGREQLYNFPFYFSDQSLREGLQEYSYSLGKIRVNPGLPNDDYGTTAFSAFHRFGYSDALTLGARVEATENLSNAGLEAVWRNDQWGVFAASASASDYQGFASQASMLAYTYVQPSFGVRAVARYYDENYAPLETLLTHFNRQGEYGLSLSWYPAAGHSVNFNHTLTQTFDQGSTRTSSINYQQSISASNLWFATLQHTDTQTPPASVWSLFAGWIFRFGGKDSASAYATSDDTGHQNTTTQLQHDVPFGEGLGYRVGWTGTQPDNADRLNGFAQWNLPALSVSVDAYTVFAQGRQVDYHEFAAAGSIVFAGPAWGLARPINDSFAIVQLGAPVRGVHILANSQDVGVSNRNGQVVSPYLGSFYESRLSLEDRDVPLDYVMGREFYTVKPAYRSGVHVDFGLRRIRALDGVLRWHTKAETPTADHQHVNLTQDGKIVQAFQVGSKGHFYLENIKPGSYLGSIRSDEHSCSFSLQVPDQQETVYTLPGDLICE